MDEVTVTLGGNDIVIFKRNLPDVELLLDHVGYVISYGNRTCSNKPLLTSHIVGIGKGTFGMTEETYSDIECSLDKQFDCFSYLCDSKVYYIFNVIQRLGIVEAFLYVLRSIGFNTTLVIVQDIETQCESDLSSVLDLINVFRTKDICFGYCHYEQWIVCVFPGQEVEIVKGYDLIEIKSLPLINFYINLDLKGKWKHNDMVCFGSVGCCVNLIGGRILPKVDVVLFEGNNYNKFIEALLIKGVTVFLKQGDLFFKVVSLFDRFELLDLKSCEVSLIDVDNFALKIPIGQYDCDLSIDNGDYLAMRKLVHQISDLQLLKKKVNPFELVPAYYKGERLVCRSGLKMVELIFRFDILRMNEGYVLDLGGAPGGWIQVLSKHVPGNRIFSSSYDGGDCSYINKFGCNVLFNKTYSLNLTDLESIEILVDRLSKKCGLVISDACRSKGQSETVSELEHFKMFLGASIMAFGCLLDKGNFVCKVYDLCHSGSLSLVLLLHKCFKCVRIVKLFTSRPASAEKYVVCYGFRRDFEYTDGLKSVFYGDPRKSICPIQFFKKETIEQLKADIVKLQEEQMVYMNYILHEDSKVLANINRTQNQLAILAKHDIEKFFNDLR
jgi:23S rRNA U2552 (ribose-2'-O)-methylase RlmE/FtsJ